MDHDSVLRFLLEKVRDGKLAIRDAVPLVRGVAEAAVREPAAQPIALADHPLTRRARG